MQDTNIYSLTFPAFVGILGIVAWFLLQRQIKKADAESAKRDFTIDSKFKDHETRMNQHDDRLRQAEIELERKTTREELEKVSDKLSTSVENLRTEFKSDIQNLQQVILAAVGRSNHGA